MASGPEKRMVKKIREALREKYPEGLFSKIHGNMYQESGMEDLIGCLNGRYCGIEVKDRDKVPAPIQLKRGRDVIKAGGVWGVAETVQEALDIAAKCFKSDV